MTLPFQLLRRAYPAAIELPRQPVFLSYVQLQEIDQRVGELMAVAWRMFNEGDGSP